MFFIPTERTEVSRVHETLSTSRKKCKRKWHLLTISLARNFNWILFFSFSYSLNRHYNIVSRSLDPSEFRRDRRSLFRLTWCLSAFFTSKYSKENLLLCCRFRVDSPFPIEYAKRNKKTEGWSFSHEESPSVVLICLFQIFHIPLDAGSESDPKDLTLNTMNLQFEPIIQSKKTWIFLVCKNYEHPKLSMHLFPFFISCLFLDLSPVHVSTVSPVLCNTAQQRTEFCIAWPKGIDT